jgi:hypothetical protein
MKLKFKNVLPNPYRDLKGNPLLSEKVAELVASINTTGFWDNVVVRKNKVGKYELAYGHHRVRAAIEAGLVEADFIVKELSDALMIQIMDNENREVYASSPASMIESVKAVVAALAEGSIPPLPLPENLRGGGIRYAPSYIPASEQVLSRQNLPDAKKAYTVTAIAKFLGRTIRNRNGEYESAAPVIYSALDFLRLKEKGYITSAILVSKDKTGEIRSISSKELGRITSGIQERVVNVEERRGETQAEKSALREKKLALQKKAKEDADKAEAENNALVKKLADAQLEENNKKADELVAKLKKQQDDSRNVEVRNQVAMKALEDKLAQKKAWEAEQRVQDEYLPIRRDVEAMIGKLETMVSERNPLREQVKSLANCKGLKPEDRNRLRKAAVDVSNWFGDWVAPQFAPELKAAQKRAVDTRKAAQIRTKGSGA